MDFHYQSVIVEDMKQRLKTLRERTDIVIAGGTKKIGGSV